MDPKLSPAEDTPRGARLFWLRCVDCGAALATATAPEFPDTFAGIIRPFLKMLALKLDLSSEVRERVTGDDPFAILGDDKMVPAMFSLRCSDCTVKNAAA